MKKYPFSALVFGALVFTLIFIQGCATGSKPRMAVYVTGQMEPNEKKVLNSVMLDIFVNSGKYETIERSEAFLEEIQKEQAKQRSGSVDDNQISRLGKQFGVQFVCVADVTDAYGSKFVSARLIDVETAVVVASSRAKSELKESEEVEAVSNNLVSHILKTSIATKKAKNTENIANKANDNVETKTEEKVEDKAKIETEQKTENKMETKTEDKAEEKVKIETENKVEEYNRYNRPSRNNYLHDYYNNNDD